MDYREKLKRERRARPAQELTAQDPSIDSLVQTAGLFDVYKYSDYPEVNLVVDDLFNQIRLLRDSKDIRIRKAHNVKKHLKVVLIDLWAGNRLGFNPYHGISKNKSDYQKGDRYRKLHLTFDYLIPVIDDLTSLGFIEQIPGSWKEGIRTRIKATDKLIDLIMNPDFGVDKVVLSKGDIAIVSKDPQVKSELILLRNSKGELIDYRDNAATHRMRENLIQINAKIASSRVTLKITDQQFVELEKRIKHRQDPTRQSIDFTRNELHRVFNNGSFEQGGRFYGGWWQNIPREYRKFIEINHKPTVELDYSGHHIRLLYAMDNLEPPLDPYDITGFERELQKQVVMIIINSPTKKIAITKIEHLGILKHTDLVKQLLERHQAISKHFFTGAGLGLMYQDSRLAEAVMLEMLKRNATVLPVHDSFIVRNSYDQELEEVMNNEFARMFGKKAKLSFKRTALEDDATRKLELGESGVSTTTNLEELFRRGVAPYGKHNQIWGFS